MIGVKKKRGEKPYAFFEFLQPNLIRSVTEEMAKSPLDYL